MLSIIRRRCCIRELPTGTVTLLFTDIEGSTRLLQQHSERYARLLEACRSLLRAAFLQFHGHEVDTQLAEHFTDGTWFVSLAPISDPDLVIPTISQTLGLREAQGQAPA